MVGNAEILRRAIASESFPRKAFECALYEQRYLQSNCCYCHAFAAFPSFSLLKLCSKLCHHGHAEQCVPPPPPLSHRGFVSASYHSISALISSYTTRWHNRPISDDISGLLLLPEAQFSHGTYVNLASGHLV